MNLVERDTPMHTLRERLREAAAQGHVALIAGEAGIGKTSVLRAVAAAYVGPVWWGACDALETPHPLAPLLDIAREDAPQLLSLMNGPRSMLFDAMLDRMRSADVPLLLVIEDVHWADDATLDLLRFIGRRIERTRALLALSYRDDEVTASHPLRKVLGELPAATTTRIELPSLSSGAVQMLAARAGKPSAGVHAVSGGNPFFVTELLNSDSVERVPRTVEDHVLSRFARLPTSAQAFVQWVSVVPCRAERWLLDALLAPSLDVVQAALASGLMTIDDGHVWFRHELARAAVEQSLLSPHAQLMHAQVLAALAAHPATTMARLVHHAARASDRTAVSRYAPLAAGQATERGAHREAVAHWRTALRHGDARDDAQRQQWLEAYALGCQFTDQLSEALDARHELAMSYRHTGNVLDEARNLSQRALVQALMLCHEQGDADSLRAIGLLAPLPQCAEQAHAFCVHSRLRLLKRDCASSADWARRSITLADAHGHREIQVEARATLGAALLFIDWAQGLAYLQQALRSALDHGMQRLAASTCVDVGRGACELFRFADADLWLHRAMEYAQRQEIDFHALDATAWLARCEFYTGRWELADEHAQQVVQCAGATPTSRLVALVTLGRLRARRGDAGAEDVLLQALHLAKGAGTLQHLGPVRCALAEWAWLQGDAGRAADEATAALPLPLPLSSSAMQRSHPWLLGELTAWRWRTGAQRWVPQGCAEPHALTIAGQWREAAQAWQALACPYETALAKADGDVEAQREALVQLDALGARPAAEALRRKLRHAGVRGIARGKRVSTRSHPCGLTDAEARVLALMCADMRNAEIAERLHRSVRTVHHHVGAVLAKLNVDSRSAAVRRAEREGWLPSRPGHTGIAIQSSDPSRRDVRVDPSAR